MRGRGAAGLCALGMLLLLLGGFLLGVYRTGTNEAVYRAVHRQTADYDSIGLTPEETDKALSSLARYLRGDGQALDDSPFGEREKRHMQDVRALFQVCARLSAACLAWGAGLVLLCAGRAGRRGTVLSLAVSWLAAVLIALPLVFADFDALFLRFHQLLFRSDLWRMDPNTQVMIRMLPQAFFERMARRLLCPAYPLGAQAIGLLGAEIVRAASTRWGKEHAIRANCPRKGTGAA